MEDQGRYGGSFLGKIELNIFNFDGTLFRSPCPNPAVRELSFLNQEPFLISQSVKDLSEIFLADGGLNSPPASRHHATLGSVPMLTSPFPSQIWDLNSISKLKSMPGQIQQGLGWFQDVATVSPPAVPDPAPNHLWMKDIVSLVMSSMSNKSTADGVTRCVTVLLAGRSAAFEPVIQRLVAQKGLRFDKLGFKNTDESHTIEFKTRFISQMVQEHKPRFVNIFEDKKTQADQLTAFCAHKLEPQGILWRVYNVGGQDNESYLPRHVELDLARYLIHKHGSGEYEIEEDIKYTGVMLDKECQRDLARVRGNDIDML